MELLQGLARARRTQHTVHPVHGEPVVAEAVERREGVAVSRQLKSPGLDSSSPLLLAQQLAGCHSWDVPGP